MNSMGTRERIVEAADQLFYAHGFEHTSFADIAAAVKLSRGNFYYHFKTKDDILDAVIEKRLADSQAMVEQWEIKGDTPKDRIRGYIHIVLDHRDLIKQHGCPVGTLTSELAKLNHDAQGEANKLFLLFRTWLKHQFAQMGSKTKDADRMAMHVLAWSQGVATMANAFQDDTFIRQEVRQIEDWLDTCG